MRSRIVSIVISVLLFSSSFYVVGLTGDAEEVTTAIQTTIETTTATVDTTAGTTTPATETTVSEPTSAVDITVNNTTVTEAESKVETVICSFSDISYGSNNMQTLDLKLPIDDREETGLFLYIHGGAWVSGDKSATTNVNAIKSAGSDYATASINYRYAEYGKFDVYDIIDDITAAITHIKTLAAGYSVNINKVVLGGSSAGGHLALLYAYRFKELSPVEIVGVIASCPAVDLTNEEFLTESSIGDEDQMCEIISDVCGTRITARTREKYTNLLEEISPINYVSASCVPTIINHGKKDKIAPFSASEELCKKLEENSVEYEFVVFENSGHQLNEDSQASKKFEELSYKTIREWLNIPV